MTPQRVDEAVEGAAFVFGAGAPFGERAPGDELFDVLQADHARAHGLRPLHHHPGQAANLLADGLAALGFAEMLAVRAGPQQAHWPTAGSNVWIDLKHITDIVLGLRVIDGV